MTEPTTHQDEEPKDPLTLEIERTIAALEATTNPEVRNLLGRRLMKLQSEQHMTTPTLAEALSDSTALHEVVVRFFYALAAMLVILVLFIWLV